MSSATASRPWHDLPPEVTDALAGELPGVAEEIIAAIRVEVPAYARPIEGDFGRGLRVGVEEALRQFVADVGSGGRTPRKRVYIDLGRGEMRARRSLEALLSAYRVGARVAWRRFWAAGMEARLEPETLYRLAEAIFAYIDELSALSAQGYAREQTVVVGELRVRRQHLVRVLLREAPVDREEAEKAARRARWPLPERVAVLAFPQGDHERVLAALPAAIVEPVGAIACAIVPDPETPGGRRALTGAIAPRYAAVGPTVPWSEARVSFLRARAVLELAEEGAIEAHGLIEAREHIAALLVHSDPGLAQELVRDRLAPLACLRPGPRARLLETLAAWLAAQGRQTEVAERLGVHPQTVRYRVRQLRDCFGAALDDPDRRFELDLALRAARAVDGAA